jgi:hypothetical protein
LARQGTPQPPQWSWLEVRSKQPPPSKLEGAQQPSGGAAQARAGVVPGQLHRPPMQPSPELQAWPQAPQFIASLSGLTQVPPQQACPVVHWVLPH